MKTKSRGLASIGEDIAIPSGAVFFFEIVDRQIHIQYPVLAAEVFGLWDFAALRRTRARIDCRLLGAKGQRTWAEPKA